MTGRDRVKTTTTPPHTTAMYTESLGLSTWVCPRGCSLSLSKPVCVLPLYIADQSASTTPPPAAAAAAEKPSPCLRTPGVAGLGFGADANSHLRRHIGHVFLF